MSLKRLAPSYSSRFKTSMEKIKGGKVILNVGCGDGEYDRNLSKRFDQIIGIDVGKNGVKNAVRNRKNNTFYAIASGGKLPFKKNIFDAVMCIDVLEHVENDDVLLSEMNRTLKKDGKMFISVPNKNYPPAYDPINFISERFFGKHFSIGIWGFGHVRLYTEKSIKNKLKKHGFTVKKLEFLNSHFAGFLENYMSTLFHGKVKSEGNQNSKPPPQFLLNAVDSVLRFDKFLFGKSKTSIGMFLVAEKSK